MALRVEDMAPMTAEDIARHRRSRPEPGHSRDAFVFPRMGGLDDADEPLVPPTADDVVDGDSVQLAPKPLGVPLRGRDLYQAVFRHYLTWCRQNREFFKQRAAMLKATSPLQFGHLTQAQLEDWLTSDEMLTQVCDEKAKAACAHAAKTFGWDEPQRLDLVSTPHRVAERPKVLLPGQVGR